MGMVMMLLHRTHSILQGSSAQNLCPAHNQANGHFTASVKLVQLFTDCRGEDEHLGPAVGSLTGAGVDYTLTVVVNDGINIGAGTEKGRDDDYCVHAWIEDEKGGAGEKKQSTPGHSPSPIWNWSSKFTTNGLEGKSLNLEARSSSSGALFGRCQMPLVGFKPLGEYHFESELKLSEERMAAASAEGKKAARPVISFQVKVQAPCDEVGDDISEIQVTPIRLLGCSRNTVGFVSFLTSDYGKYKEKLAFAKEGNIWPWVPHCMSLDQQDGKHLVSLATTVTASNFVAESSLSDLRSAVQPLRVHPLQTALDTNSQTAGVVIEAFTRESKEIERDAKIRPLILKGSERCSFLGHVHVPLTKLRVQESNPSATHSHTVDSPKNAAGHAHLNLTDIKFVPAAKYEEELVGAKMSVSICSWSRQQLDDFRKSQQPVEDLSLDDSQAATIILQNIQNIRSAADAQGSTDEKENVDADESTDMQQETPGMDNHLSPSDESQVSLAANESADVQKKTLGIDSHLSPSDENQVSLAANESADMQEKTPSIGSYLSPPSKNQVSAAAREWFAEVEKANLTEDQKLAAIRSCGVEIVGLRRKLRKLLTLLNQQRGHQYELERMEHLLKKKHLRDIQKLSRDQLVHMVLKYSSLFTSEKRSHKQSKDRIQEMHADVLQVTNLKERLGTAARTEGNQSSFL